MKEMNTKTQNSQTPPPPQEAPQIAVDGFNQVLEMLKIADPEFRESLLKRLALRDRELARTLRNDLGL